MGHTLMTNSFPLPLSKYQEVLERREGAELVLALVRVVLVRVQESPVPHLWGQLLGDACAELWAAWACLHHGDL